MAAGDTTVGFTPSRANKAIWKALSRNPRAPADLSEQAYRQCIGNVNDPARMRSFVRNPDCPPAVKQLAAARLWKSTLHGCDSLLHREDQRIRLNSLMDSLGKLDDAALVSAYRQDCLSLFEHPEDGQFGRACGALAADEVALDSEQVNACLNSRSRGVRLLGLAHPKAALELLIKRSKSTDWVVRMAIARNTSIPPNVLASLKKDPHELVTRQAQETEQVKAQDRVRQAEVLASTTGPFSLQPVVAAICHRLRESCRPWQLVGTRWWGQLTVTQRLGHADPKLLLNSPLTPDQMANAQEAWIRCVAASSPQASADLLEVLAKDQDEEVRAAVARNAQAPLALLEILAKDKKPGVRREVAWNPHTPLPLLEKLAKDKMYEVSSVVGRNPLLPVPVLEVLAKDADRSVRINLAGNPQTPPHILEILVKDVDELVPSYVAKNPKTSPHILEILAKDVSVSIRQMVAIHPQTPLHILEILAKDEHHDVLEQIANNPRSPSSLLIMLASNETPSVREAVAKHPQTPLHTLEMLAKDVHGWVRIRAAENPQTPPHTLEILAKDVNGRVRVEVSKNAQAPLQTLEILAQDMDESVRWSVAKNPKTPQHILEILAKDVGEVRRSVAENTKTPQHILEILAKDVKEWVRRSVAKNPQTPLHIMKMLAKDAEEYVRFNVASNIATPWELLQSISEDKDKYAASIYSDLKTQHASYRVDLRLATEAPAAAQDQLLELAREGLWGIRLAALNNPSMPTSSRQAGLDALWSEVESSLRVPGAPQPPADANLQDVITALHAMDLILDPTEKKALAAAAKSKDLLKRVGAILTPGIQPSLLRMLLDDEVETVRQLAASKLRELEAVQ